MARKPLSKRVRFDVFKRDLFCCQYCGAHPPDVILELDHISPVSDGGSDDESNLLTSCFNCNRGKSTTPLHVVPKSLAEKGAEIAEREAQIAGYRDITDARAERIETDLWDVVEILFPPREENGVLEIRRDFKQSIKTFLTRLAYDDVMEAAEIARARQNYENSRFRYFCGICWNKIKRGQADG